ncbi:hypothetical protein MBLNU459_g7939t1 [Dothideomycetes sp. NU459]
MEAAPPETLFRASKRRKVTRKRHNDDDSDDQLPQPASATAHPIDLTGTSSAAVEPRTVRGGPEDEQQDATTWERVFRQRRPLGARMRGIGFSTSTAPKPSPDASNVVDRSSAVVPTENAVELATGRFVAPTGHVVSSDDKHMMAYVDSKLASIRSQSTTREITPATAALDPPTAAVVASPQQSTQPAVNGELQEVDLGPSATSLNIALTEAARRRLEGAKDTQPARTAEKTKPVRLGRDGKPLRPRRQPARRSSNDLARDAMVEEVFKESILGIYDDSARQEPLTSSRTGQNEDADERMVEEFKREFMANQQERNFRKAPPPPPGAKGESTKGPKLGGSRSQRAAMRAMEEKAAAAKGKK